MDRITDVGVTVKPPRPLKPTQLTKHQQLQAQQALPSHWDPYALSDQQIVDNPPPPTGYNSYEGYKIISGKKYFHGDMGPDGRPVQAPILTDEEWAAKFEKFDLITYKPSEKTGKPIKHKQALPASFNTIDHRFMKEINLHDQFMILAFRDARKSSNGARFVKRQILDYGSTIAYFCATSKHTIKFSEKIRAELTKNVAILREYGYVIDDTMSNKKDIMYWKSQSLTTAFDPGLTIGSAEGVSLMGGHPDVIILDDVVGEEASGHDVQLESIITWYTAQIEPMATEFTKLIIIGTIKDPKDLYNFLIGTNMMSYLKLPAILDWPNGGQTMSAELGTKNKWYYVKHQGPNDNIPLIKGVKGLEGGKVGFDEYSKNYWIYAGRVQYYINDDETQGLDKNRMSMQEFLLKRHKITPEKFECEYQMESLKISSGYLHLEKMKTFTWQDVEDDMPELESNTIAFYDPSSGTSERADWNFISVVSKLPGKGDDGLDDFYILDCFAWKNDIRGVFGKIEKIQQVRQLYPYIQFLGIESGIGQTNDAQMIENYMPDFIKQVYMNNYKATDQEDEVSMKKLIIEFEEKLAATKKSKAIRILNQWTTRLSAGRIHIREGIQDPDAMMIIKQSGSFPKKGTIFEFLDAGGNAMDQCAEGGITNFMFEHN